MIALYRELKNELSLEVSLGLIKKLMLHTFREFVRQLVEMQKNRLKKIDAKWNIFDVNYRPPKIRPILIHKNKALINVKDKMFITRKNERRKNE